MEHPLTFIQVTNPVDVLAEIYSVGGLTSLILAIAVVAVFREYRRKDAILQRVTEQAAADAREGIRVTTAMEKLLDHLQDQQEHGERRILKAIASEGERIRIMIHSYQDKVNQHKP